MKTNKCHIPMAKLLNLIMITILIRASYRPNGFAKTLKSIQEQTYPNIKIICSYDDERALSYIPEDIQKVRVYKTKYQFGFDSYVNTLKSLVLDGWFMVVDENDTMIDSEVISRLSRHFVGNHGIVCQFSRNGRLKPSNELIRKRQIIRCKIGMPCLVLHSDRKDVAFLDGSKSAADYLWIKEVSKKVKLKFVAMPVVFAEKRDGGVTEG